MRPAALMRGPSRKPSECSESSAGATPPTSISARSPGLRVRPSATRPSRTMRRFSPRSGTRSQTVASAARSTSSAASAGSRPAAANSASLSFSTTPGGAQLGTAVVAERRVHDRAVGQLLARSVVVGDHHVEPHSASGRDLLDRRDAAVDRDQQLDTAPAQPLHGRPGEAVALVEAARQLPDGVGAERAQGPQQHRGGADAVHVVVAEHGDNGAALHVREDQLTCRGNARQGERVVRLLGRQEATRLLDIAEATAREDRAHDRRDAEPLGQPPAARDLVRVAPPARRLRLHPADTAARSGRNGLQAASARRRGSGRGRCRARGPRGRRTSRRAPGRSVAPGMAIRAWRMSVSFWPGIVSPFARKPTRADDSTAAPNAPTIPPQ